MAKYTRKGRNPGPVDEWLEVLGFYRKNVAYDETCMFRAVSEQIMSSQLHHERIRKQCIAYGREHYDEFRMFYPYIVEWDERLDQLEKHMVVCGPVEIELISRTYNKNIITFDGVNLLVNDMQLSQKDQYKNSLFICHMGEDHYDAVYYKEYIEDAGFCQSLIYTALYENVYNIPKVAEIVDTMLYHKTPTASASQAIDSKPSTSSEFGNQIMGANDADASAASSALEAREVVTGILGSLGAPWSLGDGMAFDSGDNNSIVPTTSDICIPTNGDFPHELEIKQPTDRDHAGDNVDDKATKAVDGPGADTTGDGEDAGRTNEMDVMMKTNLAPFPFKVAKALDPNIYRNIEYDTWTETRKEMRLGDWYYGDTNFIEGSACILHVNGQQHHCYIQEMVKNDDSAIVFLTHRGERRLVKLRDLTPERDAKPWPLPYRFSKHLVVSIPKLDLPDKKSMRKRREKKRTTSKSSNVSEARSVEHTENAPAGGSGGGGGGGAAIASTSAGGAGASASNAYEGAPLQMHQQKQHEQQHLQQQQQQQQQQEEDMEAAMGQQAAPQEQVYEGGWQRQEVAMPMSPMVWPPTPPVTQNMYAYNHNNNNNNNNNMVSTPDGYVPEQGFYSEFQPPQQPYAIWPNGEYLPPLPPQSPQVEMPITPDGFNYYFSDGSPYSPNYYGNPNARAFQPVMPPSPQVDGYSHQQVYPQMGTPMIVQSGPAPDMMPMGGPMPMQHMQPMQPMQHMQPMQPMQPMQQMQQMQQMVYSPAPVDMHQHQSPFVFPPTPNQPAWYQAPAINSQGFIFPSINIPNSPNPIPNQQGQAQ